MDHWSNRSVYWSCQHPYKTQTDIIQFPCDPAHHAFQPIGDPPRH